MQHTGGAWMRELIAWCKAEHVCVKLQRFCCQSGWGQKKRSCRRHWLIRPIVVIYLHFKDTESRLGKGSILSGSVRKCLFILFSRSKLCLCNNIWMMYYRPNDFGFYKEMLVLLHLLVKWRINHFIKHSCTLWRTHVIERENDTCFPGLFCPRRQEKLRLNKTI